MSNRLLDVVDLDAMESGEDRAGLFFAAWSLAVKFIAAIGQGLLLRDRFAEKVYKALIVDDGVGYEDGGGYHGWIAFDYTRVRP